MIASWKKLKGMRRSITLLSATLIGVVTTIMLICAAALLIRFGGDDDGTWHIIYQEVGAHPTGEGTDCPSG